MSRCSNIPAAYLILLRDDKVLLLRRHNTGYRDGEYSFIAGHVEEGESFTAAIIREAREEAGIIVHEEDLTTSHVMHRKSDDSVWVDIFFTAENWTGDAINREPDKCSDLSWFPLDNLPEKTIPYIRRVMNYLREKKYYSEEGWLPAP
jgi:8-oxo-dGTP diphosphatase